MSLIAISVLLLLSMNVGFGQKERTAATNPEQVTLLAEREIKDGGTLKLRGHVQVITSSTIFYADEADYNPLTGKLDARGHVHIEFKKVSPSVIIQNSAPEDVPVS